MTTAVDAFAAKPRSGTLYLACFRHAASTADRLIQERYPKVALLGAGSRGEFREEDQMGCAWIAASLERAGYVPEDAASAQIVHRWGDAPASAWLISKSVDYLRPEPDRRLAIHSRSSKRPARALHR